jgi:hypothetical protein
MEMGRSRALGDLSGLDARAGAQSNGHVGVIGHEQAAVLLQASGRWGAGGA